MAGRWKQVALLLFLVMFLAVIPLIAFLGLFTGGFKIDTGKVALVLEVRGKMPEYNEPFSAGMILGQRERTLTELLAAINGAAGDDRVKALVLKVFPSGAGTGKCEEIRRAIKRFRETGKKVITFSPILVNHHYLVACASDTIFMPPSGYLAIPGPASSAVFIRGTLEKLGINPNIHRIEDYKSAAEMFTERKRTPESREMARRLLGDVFERFVDTIAEERGCEEETVRMWIDRGLYSPRRALNEGLIDGVRYWDQIEDSFDEAGITFVNFREYVRSAGSIYSGGRAENVAVIHAQGTIVMGGSGIDPLAGIKMGSETVIRELRRVRENRRIKAVILRVDSPGGDGLAGEMISREVEITSREKPVVVSMSDVAASGGYEISYRADCIVALPGSITGSIGSITGKMNMRGLYEKIGVTKDEMAAGEKALIFSDYRDFSDDEWKVVEEGHWEFYRNWIENIAHFRDMDVEEVDSVARGRVWTGRQAVERGLVDEVGDFSRALEIACELAGIEDPAGVSIIHLPTRLSLLQGILSGGFLDGAAARLMNRIIYEWFSPERRFFLLRRMHGVMETGKTSQNL